MKKLLILLIFFTMTTYAGRFYSSEYGRWLNRDPISVNGGINTYNSMSNNMVNGFSGGLSFSDGMELALGHIVESFGVDPWGNDEAARLHDIAKRINDRHLNQTRNYKFKVNSEKSGYAGDLDFTMSTFLTATTAGVDVRGGFKLKKFPTNLKIEIEYECDELRWIQNIKTNESFSKWGNHNALDPLKHPDPNFYTKNSTNDKPDKYPFYRDFDSIGMLRKDGYNPRYEDSPQRALNILKFDNSIVNWEAEFCLVSWDKTKRTVKFWSCFKYGFKIGALFDSNGVKRSHIVTPVWLRKTGDKPSPDLRNSLKAFHDDPVFWNKSKDKILLPQVK